MTQPIGIDLGTTYTVAAILREGRPCVIPNAEGELLTPSVVAFPASGPPLVGLSAKEQAALNPQRTVFSVKRRIGSPSRWALQDGQYTPQRLSSFILQKIKADAERYLGEGIERAVITVPAYFSDRQRQATVEAASLAGIEVMRLLNEPTAAALAYGLDREEAHTVLVWDLGGGTFDVSILELGEGIFEVRAVSGDCWLGGDDFDSRAVDYLLDAYQKARGTPFPPDPGARQRLRDLAEQVKRELSSVAAVDIRVPALESPGVEQSTIRLTREQLEGLTQDLLHRMAAPTQRALADAHLAPENIDRVILVGGATRMPAVRRLARQLFGQEPYRYVDPDLAVAMGAAIQAAMLLGRMERFVLMDVLPLSLGVDTQGGLMATVIPRNTPLPASSSRIFTTASDNQDCMNIHVLQGERALAVENISLGQVELNGLPLAPRGVPKVEVTFQADVDGIVHVSAKELWTEGEVRLRVVAAKSLDRREIGSLVQAADPWACPNPQAPLSLQGQGITSEGGMWVQSLPESA